MERFLLNFTLVLILVYFYKITRNGLHILQLENYYVDRYVSKYQGYNSTINTNYMFLH